jgi:hypothetical protein
MIGVILRGLTDLYVVTQNTTYLQLAHQIANAVLNSNNGLVNTNGILVEPCDPNDSCGGDGTQFKGIFVHCLLYLHMTSPDSSYVTFFTNNANSIWSNNQNNNAFGERWYGPFDLADASRQSSALDALNAAFIAQNVVFMNK